MDRGSGKLARGNPHQQNRQASADRSVRPLPHCLQRERRQGCDRPRNLPWLSRYRPLSALIKACPRRTRRVEAGAGRSPCRVLGLPDSVLGCVRIAALGCRAPAGGRCGVSRRLLPAGPAVLRLSATAATPVTADEADHSAGLGRRRAWSDTRDRASREDLGRRASGSRPSSLRRLELDRLRAGLGQSRSRSRDRTERGSFTEMRIPEAPLRSVPG